jgi:hypothetical protein
MAKIKKKEKERICKRKENLKSMSNKNAKDKTNKIE